MILRGLRARAIALVSIVILSPAVVLGSAPRPIERLPAAAFSPVPGPATSAPSGPGATISAPPSSASPRPYARPTPAPATRPRPVISQTSHRLTSNAHPANGRSTAGSSSIRGIASWYCNADARRARLSKCMAVHPDTRGFDAYAAAGPALRVAMGGGVSINAPDPWRGKIVTVCGRTCQRVKLADWCACNTDPAHPKLLDLYYDVYALTGSSVRVSW